MLEINFIKLLKLVIENVYKSYLLTSNNRATINYINY